MLDRNIIHKYKFNVIFLWQSAYTSKTFFGTSQHCSPGPAKTQSLIPCNSLKSIIH